MGKSFVSFRDSGFWARDGILEVWFRLMALNLPDDSYLESHWLREVRDQWLFTSSGMCNGWVSPHLDHFVASDDRARTFLAVSDNVLNILYQFGEKVPAAFLNALGVKASFSDQPVQWYKEMHDTFTSLLAGRLHSDAESSVVLPSLQIVAPVGEQTNSSGQAGASSD